jgi:hypothetical protein
MLPAVLVCDGALSYRAGPLPVGGIPNVDARRPRVVDDHVRSVEAIVILTMVTGSAAAARVVTGSDEIR